MAALVLAGVAVAAAPALGAPATTLDRTIQDTDGDNLLQYAPGEAYTVFGAAPGFRPPKHGSLLNFLQLSDFQMVDEESPGRVELLDTTQRVPGANPFSAAYRPQEALTTQVTEAMVRQVRNAVLAASPASRSSSASSPATTPTRSSTTRRAGSSTSSTATAASTPTRACTSAVSGCTLPPGSSTPTTARSTTACAGAAAPGRMAATTSPTATGDGDGYTPDRAAQPGRGAGPARRRDGARLPRPARARPAALRGKSGSACPGTRRSATTTRSCRATARTRSSGPSARAARRSTPRFDALARGCLKPSHAAAGTHPGAVRRRSRGRAARSQPTVVPPDPRRCYVAKDEPNNGAATPCDTGGWIQQHSRTRGLAVGPRLRGPTSAAACAGRVARPGARANHDGYYSFSPRRGLRFVVLDTITDECGVPVCSRGLGRRRAVPLAGAAQLAAAAQPASTCWPSPTTRCARRACPRPTRPSSRSTSASGSTARATRPSRCAPTRWTRSRTSSATTPNFVAHVTGHEHANYVLEHGCEDPAPGHERVLDEISTAAHIDWPQQSRMIELVENSDGTLSLVLTMLDHGGRARCRRAGSAGELDLAARLDRARAVVQRLPGQPRRARAAAGPQRDHQDVEALAVLQVA